MRFQITSVLTIVSATLAVASPAWQAGIDFVGNKVQRRGATETDDGSVRPMVTVAPIHPRLPPPVHGKRTKICHVGYNHHQPDADDSDHVIDAMRRCNDGGHVIFSPGVTYNIAKALDLTFLKHIDIDIQGEILFSNDTTYWQANSFKFIFQNVTSFWQFGGEDIFIYGGGTINGNGQVWYDLYAANIYTLRPVLIGINGLHDSTITNLNLRYSPQYYHFVANSTNVIFDNINIAGGSVSQNVAKNTDGWDTYRSSDLTIQNSHVDNGDDCIAFKPNCTNLLIQNMFCNGSHGISVGSLGQYPGEYDIVENVYVYNTSMHNASDGARIKVWPNAPSELSGDLQGGGGAGRVNNITYDTFLIDNVDYAIEVDQCYGQSNITLCNEFPSPLTITNILFNNFMGTTSTKYQPEIGAFACSSTAVCSGITASSINVMSPNGSKLAYCQNVNAATLDVTCSTVLEGFN